MISSAAPTKPKAEREAFPIPGPGRGKHFSEFSDTITFGFPKLLFHKYRTVEIRNVYYPWDNI